MDSKRNRRERERERERETKLRRRGDSVFFGEGHHGADAFDGRLFQNEAAERDEEGRGRGAK